MKLILIRKKQIKKPPSKVNMITKRKRKSRKLQRIRIKSRARRRIKIGRKKTKICLTTLAKMKTICEPKPLGMKEEQHRLLNLETH